MLALVLEDQEGLGIDGQSVRKFAGETPFPQVTSDLGGMIHRYQRERWAATGKLYQWSQKFWRGRNEFEDYLGNVG